MTGNPFRQSQLPASTTSAASPRQSNSSSGFPYADSNSTDGTVRDHDDSGNGTAPPSQRPKTKKSKSVRIESPTFEIPTPQPGEHDGGDSLVNRISQGKHAGSPPPSHTVDTADGFHDRSREYNGDDVYGRDMNGSMRISPDMVAQVQPSPSGVPNNPFSRTLASIEPQGHGGVELAHAGGQNREGTSTEKPGAGTPKANLDVESFKRMLMTGVSSSPGTNQTPNHTAPAPTPPAPAAIESSSTSTETSSVSRQSISEHALHEPHTETPRKSYEMARSDDEMVGLVAAVKTEKKKPPPAPKHRHGKLVSSRAPQTVSFTEFEAMQFTPASPVSEHRTHTDLNKPLPPTPPVVSPPTHIIPQDITQEPSADAPPLETSSSPLSLQTHTPPTQKKVPPPVPLARRQSQLRTSTTGGTRSRSGSNRTISSQHSISEELGLGPHTNHETPPPASSPSSHKVPPPPPPSRRHGPSLSSGTPPSASSSTTELPSRSSSTRRNNISSPDPQPMSRKANPSSHTSSPITDQLGISRTASMNSNHRNNSRSVSAESSSMAPPPPPPRRRQSGRSARTSLDPDHTHSSSPTESRRSSCEIKTDRRRTSVASESSLKYEYSPAVEHEHPLFSPQEEVEESSSRLGDSGVEGGKLMPVQAQGSGDLKSDILDDMEKFQREIDELRERYQKGAGSGS